jgi:endo-1,4-beta-xylanase
MKKIDRRRFIKRTVLAGTGAAIASNAVLSSPLVLTGKRSTTNTTMGELVFQPHFTQKGRGPHLLDWAYASDPNWDAFHSNITASRNEGVRISDTGGRSKFGVDVRWNVEGFGYLFITADNGGEYYELPLSGASMTLNLNFELAKSRVLRNRRRYDAFMKEGWNPSRECTAYLDIAEDYYHEATKIRGDEIRRAEHAQRALYYALWGGEKIETEKAEADILRNGYRPGFFFGSETAAYFLAYDSDLYLDRFLEVFNYGAVIHYWKSRIEDFEPIRGRKRFAARDVIVDAMGNKGVTLEGRPLFWFHEYCTPDWMKEMSYAELLTYTEEHVRETVGHYGDRLYSWEIVNELHDWANELRLSPEQTVELTKFACEVAKDTNPKVKRLINNCCPFAEYVQLNRYVNIEAKYPQRTPWQFMRDLVDAGVDFDVTAQQMYFPYRDLADTIIHTERLEQFGKPVFLSEVGCSSGPSKASIDTGKLGLPTEPFPWHRHWDEELQADWLEGLYTIAYSKPWIHAVNWYDFLDPYAFVPQGGLYRTLEDVEPKAAVDRLKMLQNKWKGLAGGIG